MKSIQIGHKAHHIIIRLVLGWVGVGLMASGVALAQCPPMGVLLQDTPPGVAKPASVIRSEQNILSSFKQVCPGFSTIHFKELDNFKGNVLVSPVFDNTSPGLLKSVAQKSAQHNWNVLVVSGMTRSNPWVEESLAQFGFKGIGTRFLSRSLPLQLGGFSLPTRMPVGSLVIQATTPSPPLAWWGDEAPAALTVSKNLLLNWNWVSAMPEGSLYPLLNNWFQREADAAVAREEVEAAASAAALTHLEPIAQLPEETAPPEWKRVPAVVAEPVKPTVVEAKPPVIKPTPEAQKAADDMLGDRLNLPDEVFNVSNGRRKTKSLTQLKGTAGDAEEFYNDRVRVLGDKMQQAMTLAGQFTTNPHKRQEVDVLLQQASAAKSTFEAEWLNQHYDEAMMAYDASNDALDKILFTNLPEPRVEARAIWVDRGSIVEAGTPEGMRDLIRRLVQNGFNIIYLETLNAGYPLYPSALLPMNPQIKGWDPLEVATDEAHKQGAELHAWVWTFAVSNTRLNKILGQAPGYMGPILSNPEYAKEAMRGKKGELILPEQFEGWLSPSSYKARNLLLQVFSEITRKYPVDGLQLDYIRYPFQKNYAPMGYESFAASRFTSETGLTLSEPNEFTLKAWNAWKAFQVTTFVRDVSTTLRKINPNIKLSAAVFPLARNGRMMMIQQDWETWIQNGWIDTLNPMAYSRSPGSLEHLVNYVHTAGNNQALVYPGLSLGRLNGWNLLGALQVCRENGILGTTLFASSLLRDNQEVLLQSEAYHARPALVPHQNPLVASVALMKDTHTLSSGILQANPSLKSDPQLQQLQATIRILAEALVQVDSPNRLRRDQAVDTIKDNAELLGLQASHWLETTDNPVSQLQARALKQQIDKTVPVLSYTVYKLKNQPLLPIHLGFTPSSTNTERP